MSLTVLVYLHPGNIVCFCRLACISCCLRLDLLSLLLQYVTMLAPAGCAAEILKETANAERQWVLERGTSLSLDDLVNKAISRDCTCPISQVSHIKTATALLCKSCCTSCLELPSLDPGPASFIICAITHMIRWTIKFCCFGFAL